MRISPYSRGYLRTRATQLMTDECVVMRPAEQRVVYDPVTQRATNAAATQIYTGVCRLWEVSSGATVQFQDDELVITQLYLSLPYDAPVPEPQDQVQMTGSDDTSIVGRYLAIQGIVRSGGLRGARRLSVQYIDSSKVEW